tara:strand:- start:81 stop:260 length:180 start_codon:yes stop_codon:yes gene_type:complete
MKFNKTQLEIIMHLLGRDIYDYKEGSLLRLHIEAMLGEAQEKNIWGRLPENMPEIYIEE